MKIEINNVTLNYVQSGNGKPLILLHGNGENLHIFDKLADKLKQHFTVYAIDSRNHGESSKTDDLSYESMSDDIYGFIEKLQLKDVSLIGFSDGAIIGLILSLQHADIFSKMVLLGPNLKPSDFKKTIFRELISEYEQTKDPLLKLMLEQPNIELKELKSITTPTFVIAGEDDIFYRKVFRDISKAIKGSELKIIKGHDHASYIIDNDMLYNDLHDFLK